MKTDIPMNQSMVKNHSSLKTGLGFHAIRRTSFLLWFQACQVRPLDPSKTPSRQESHSSSYSSTSSSSPTVSETQTREREDRIESDISPVHVSTTVDDRSGRPDDTQAKKTPKPNKKESKKEQSESLCSEIPRYGCKNSGKIWWMMKFQYTEILTPVLLMKCL